jgi:hypothetical protein
VVFAVVLVLGLWKKTVFPNFVHAARERFFIPQMYGFAGYLMMQLAKLSQWIDNALINRFVRFIGSVSLDIGALFRHVITGSTHGYLLAVAIGFFLLLLLIGGLV